MKPKLYLLTISLICVGFTNLYSQIISTEPTFPSPADSVIIYYDATEGTAGLKDFTGDVYAHTGVITEKSMSSSDWRYVVSDWGVNISKIKMERIEPNLYKLSIAPSIREYYNVPEDELIEKMAFVFRNSDGSKEGKAEGGDDIFAEVYESSLNVKLLKPSKRLTFQKNPDTLSIIGIGNTDSTSMDLKLFISDSLVASVSDDTLSYNFLPQQRKQYRIELTGTDGFGKDTASRMLVVNPLITDSTRPAGLKDGITYVSENVVHLSLFAPDKEFIYLIGDFTNWEVKPEFFMMRDSINPDSVYFWTEVTGLTAGKEYGFQYLVDGEIRVTDPYVSKILDESNDQYISEDTYPNLKKYPSGKTEKIVGVIQPGKPKYNWESTDYKRPGKEMLVVYELLIRDFIEEHDFETLIDTLDYIKGLGINTIELMPVMEFDANNSWGYNPTFHVAVDKYYGPADDLKAFIDACHARDMAVILDMVLNHAWGPSPLVRLWNEGDYGKPTSQNPYLNTEPTHDYNVGYDFNHESKATQYFVDRVNEYWLTEFNFDGFRFDLSKGFTQKNTLGDVAEWGRYDSSRVRILKRMADKIWEIDDSAYVILEHFADNSEEKELSNYGMLLWGNMNYSYNEATMGYNDGGKSDFSGISYQDRGWNNPHLVGYMESHDEERLMYKNLEYGNSYNGYDITELRTALDRVELAATFFIPVPGPKMIWQFGEVGYDISINYDCRTCPKPIKWEYYNEKHRRDLYNTFSILNNLKNKHEVFHTTDFSMDVSNPLKRIELRHASGDVVILGNFDMQEGSIDPKFTQTGIWYETFSRDSIDVSDVNEPVTLGAGEYRMYSTQKFEIGQYIDTSNVVSAIQSIAEASPVRVFPNPARDVVHFEVDRFAQSDIILNIYNLSGQKIKTIKRNHLPKGNSVITWESDSENSRHPELLIYEMIMGGKRYTGKFLKY